MKKPHPHADVIKKWADGAQAQYYALGEWHDMGDEPIWYRDIQLRIKPEPKPDVVAYFKSGNLVQEMVKLGASVGVVNTTKPFANLILTFCGETGKLKSAEVL